MNALAPTALKSWLPSAVARERILTEKGGALWQAEWNRVLMLHWSVPAAALQPWVPFPLDEREGRAWVSAVAFHLQGMKWRRFGLPLPLSSHTFLNLRAYVRVNDEPGIFFLREWVPWRPGVMLSRPMYGLPFVAARLRYQHRHEAGSMRGEVRSQNRALRYQAEAPQAFDVCEAGSLDEFLLERYTAFTEWRGWRRFFRVWHPPWRQAAVEAEVSDASLLGLTGNWAAQARYEGAHYSPGLPTVWMGAPHGIDGTNTKSKPS